MAESRDESGDQARVQRVEADARLQAAQAAQALRAFLGSPEGAAALELLAASGRYVRLAEAYLGGGYGVVFYLDGAGLHRSYEAMGLWMVYADEIPAPHIAPVTPEEAVEAVFTLGGGMPAEPGFDLVAWLGDGLDAIAGQAPGSSGPRSEAP